MILARLFMGVATLTFLYIIFIDDELIPSIYVAILGVLVFAVAFIMNRHDKKNAKNNSTI